MIFTRSSKKQMITRSKTTGKTEFIELEQKRKRTQTQIQTQTKKPVDDSDSDYTTEDTDPDLDVDSETVASEDSFLNKEYEVDIDFDDAHDSWMANKKRTANGTYVYICGYVKPNHKLCRIACCDKIGIYSGCKKHYMWEEKIHKRFEELTI
jgi:hypothetical protein